MYLFVCVLVYFMCMCECGCPWNPEEGIGSSGAGVKGKCELWDTGAENPTQVLQRNASHFELLNQLSYTYDFKKKKDNLKYIHIGGIAAQVTELTEHLSASSLDSGLGTGKDMSSC